MFVQYPDKATAGTIGMPEKKISPPPTGVPAIGIGSAFAALPPPVPVEQRPPDNRFLWGDPAARLHALHPSPHPGLGNLTSSSPLEFSPLATRFTSAPLGPQPGELAAPSPYRISPYMEHLYQTLHPPPQGPLRGLSPLERSSFGIANDYLGMSGIAATRLNDAHLLPSSLTSTDLAFSIDASSRLASPRPSMRQSRKRALSSSPYSDSLDINSMIRFSPNSLVSCMINGSRSSSGSGSYGHLSAGAISPALGVPPSMSAATTHLLQAQLMRGHPYLPTTPLIHQSQTVLPTHQGLYSLSSQPPMQLPIKPLAEKKDCGTLTNLEDDKKSKKEISHQVTPVGSKTARNCVAVPTSGVDQTQPQANGEDENLREEPEPDFVETNCHWTDCSKEFNTQEELVKHINNDHIHANKKSFVCRWKECSRLEKPFKAQYMLVVHMRRHTGEKPHKCTFDKCSKAYSRLENLKTHLRSHTGEKPYMCEHPGCTKAFSNASDRAKHQNRTHSSEKPYVCKAPGCTKRYTDPSSLRKHVKTVHGADFYASKKHKGNDHPSVNPGNNGKDNNANPESSPNSEPGKGSLSSPSIKSEDPTSPAHNFSPAMNIGSTVPMDQTRMVNFQITDNGISSGYDMHFPDDVDNEDDVDAGIVMAGGVMVGTAVQDRNRNRLKTKLQKGSMNLNIPSPIKRLSGNGVGELSQKITQMKVNGGQSTILDRKSIMDYQYRGGQTTLQKNRRDSTSTVSTYYGSMRSDSSNPHSRRGSELSLASCNSNGRHALNSSYDPISCGGSSRRSSDASSYNVNSASNSIATQLTRLNKPGTNTETYNTSNLIVQTQNMSLSQETLNNQNWQGHPVDQINTATTVDNTNNNSYIGASGLLGPPTPYNREGIRRSSDPVRPLDRNFDPSSRMQRYNSYYNCNYRGQIGMRPLMTPPIYNGQPQANIPEQQPGDMKQENKDRTQYNQDSNQYQSQQNHPEYQNVPGNYPVMSPNGYQYPQPPSYPIPSPIPVYNQIRSSPNPQQYTNLTNVPNQNFTPPINGVTPAISTVNGYQKPVTNCYPQNSTQNVQFPNQQPFNQQYMPYNGQISRQYNGNSQTGYNMMPGQQRFNTSFAPGYGLGTNNYGPAHICGHLSTPNLPVNSYQVPCPACQSRGYSGYEPQGYQLSNTSWQAVSGVYNQYCNNQTDNTISDSFTDNTLTQYNNNESGVVTMSVTYPNGTITDVQCHDVSQSTQIKMAEANSVTKALQEKQSETPVKPAEKTGNEKENIKKNEAKNTNNNYMKPDAYQRTLEYVERIPSWCPVKDEVSSTTDQKPQLNANGTVSGYIPANETLSMPSHFGVQLGTSSITSLHTPTFSNTPLPAAVPETPNMVLNDMHDALNTYQKENKYLQLLQ